MIDWENVITETLNQDREEKEPSLDNTFGVYYAGYCPRQIYLSKTRLKDFPRAALGSMKVGTLFHNYIEENADVDVDFEKEFEFEEDGLVIRGRADAVGEDAIYDFKSINGMQYVDDAAHRNRAQLNVYMKAFGVDKGKLVFIDKGKMYVKEKSYEYSQDVYDSTMKKYHKVQKALDKHGVVDDPDDVPFEKCGCYLCNVETLEI